MTDWIYSRDRLPDVGEAVIGSLMGVDGVPWVAMVECGRGAGGRQWTLRGRVWLPDDWSVYAWMPAPDPAAMDEPDGDV